MYPISSLDATGIFCLLVVVLLAGVAARVGFAQVGDGQAGVAVEGLVIQDSPARFKRISSAPP